VPDIELAVGRPSFSGDRPAASAARLSAAAVSDLG